VSAIRDFISQIEELRKAVKAHIPKQLFSDTIKGEMRKTTDHYFNVTRLELVEDSAAEEKIKELDSAFQNLLKLTHKNCQAKTFHNSLTYIKIRLIDLDGAILGGRGLKEKKDGQDILIVKTLNQLLPSAASSYLQALSDLEQTTRHSWRGPATDLREALRETLDHLAPDTDVISSIGFALEKDAKGPTMKQKVRFILKSRGMAKNATETIEHASQAIDEAMGSFVRSVYTRSSVSTHTPTNKSEVVRIKNLVKITLLELLELGA